MRNIVSFPEGPQRPGSSDLAATLPPVVCRSWCELGDGHPLAVNSAEQQCTGVALRIDTSHGGGLGDDQGSTSFASVVARAQQLPDQPPTFLVGLQVGDVEAFVEMNAAQLSMFVEYANILLRQTGQVGEPAA